MQQLAGYRLLHDELESILEQYGDAFVVVDRQGIVLRVNSRLRTAGRSGTTIHHREKRQSDTPGCRRSHSVGKRSAS